MISLYIILFVSLLLHPASVFAITPKYETAYACEEKTLTIGCEPGYVINLIRANYGRFSITICNDQGNVDWSVNCMSAKSLRVLYQKCSHKQNCSVLATTNMFGDPCPGTHKYLEAHYQCVLASEATSTTSRPNPAWLITTPPSVWGTSTMRFPTTAHINLEGLPPIVNRYNNNNNNNKNIGEKSSSGISSSHSNNASQSTNNGKVVDSAKDMRYPADTDMTSWIDHLKNENASAAAVTKSIYHGRVPALPNNGTMSTSPISMNSNMNEYNDTHVNESHFNNPVMPQQSINSLKTAMASFDESSGLFCGPTTARNLFWNFTRVGDINVQPCPGGATGIAKWRCTGALMPFVSKSQSRYRHTNVDDEQFDSIGTERSYMWSPNTPDLTQCRSLWLNSLEVRVNQRDTALVSVANDLSQVTNSKTLYGGDMLVTTKIIQSLCEKMTYDIETFSDQRQREAVVQELLNSVVKTGSNLLDETQQYSWMDLNFEDQMRVATSLLTGLEDNAFLLADTIAAERNVVHRVKNILLSVRVLETRNIFGNQIFPDANIEQGHIGEDSIELPHGALIENSEGGLVRIVFVAFERLESILRPMDPMALNDPKQYENAANEQAPGSGPESFMAQNASQPQQVRLRVLNSKVISASLGKGRHIQLSQPIRLILKHLLVDNVSNPTCVFWNYIDHAWSEDGCHIDQTNRTHTICMCNHLTNFAILMDLVDDTTQFIQQIGAFDANMRLLISISIAICILFLIIALLMIKFVTGIITKSNRTTIYKNLYICLLVTEVLIWLGNVQNESSMLCGFTTAFLHCAFLCIVSWIFLEGFQSYLTVKTEDILLDAENSSRIISYYLITYGLSFTVVAISLGIDPAAYTIKADACVWMDNNYLFYVTFVLPCCIWLLANIGYIALSQYIVCKKYKTTLKSKGHIRLATVRFHLRASFMFEIIFLACWFCGYFYMVNLHSIYNSFDSSTMDSIFLNISIYGYGFVIFNIVQGLFVVGFQCLQNEQIRREYQKFVGKHSWLPQCLQCGETTANSQAITHINSGSNTLTGNALLSTPSNELDSTNGKKMRNISANDIGTIVSVLEPHQQQPGHPAMTSTLMRHQHAQRQNPNYSTTGTLRDFRSNYSADSAGPSNYSKTLIGAHKPYDYGFQNANMNYQHSAPSQQFHQLKDESQMTYHDRKAHKSQYPSSNQLSSPMHPSHGEWVDGSEPSYPFNKMQRHANVDSMNSINKYLGNSAGSVGRPELSQTQKYPSHRKKHLQTMGSAHAGAHMHQNIRGALVAVDPNNVDCNNINVTPLQMNTTNRYSWLGGSGSQRQTNHLTMKNLNPINRDEDETLQYNSYGDEEPVYEEILSKNTDNCDRDRGVYDEDDDDEATRNSFKNSLAYPNSSDPLMSSSDNDNSINRNYRNPNQFPTQKPHHSRSVQGETVQSQQSQPKHPSQIGRNISAILSEKNTVVCYLEPK